MILPTPINILGQLVVTFGALKFLSEVCEWWFGEDGERRLRLWMEEFWVRVGDSKPESFVRIPVQLVTTFYERLLGPNPFSPRSLWRASIVVSLLLISSLGFTGAFCQQPFGMNQAPWQSYEMSNQILKQMANDPKLQKPDLDAFQFKENILDLASLEGLPFEICFTFYFVLVVVLSTALLNAVSIALSRLVLREILRAETSFPVFLMFLTNLVIVGSLLVTDIVFLAIALNVWTWPFVPMLLALSKLSVFSLPAMILGTTWLTWLFAAPWLKVVAVISLAPSIALVLILGGCALGFPFRKVAHVFTTRFLERGLQSKKGLFSYIGNTCILLSALIGLLVRLLSL